METANNSLKNNNNSSINKNNHNYHRTNGSATFRNAQIQKKKLEISRQNPNYESARPNLCIKMDYQIGELYCKLVSKHTTLYHTIQKKGLNHAWQIMHVLYFLLYTLAFIYDTLLLSIGFETNTWNYKHFDGKTTKTTVVLKKDPY